MIMKQKGKYCKQEKVWTGVLVLGETIPFYEKPPGLFSLR
ncbi:hypothetical protein BREVNS_2033 [Brevinematales bacterium NS]|nr:hypothetical protein BREVNS_2033 [Brevinematales bacterium NS]